MPKKMKTVKIEGRVESCALSAMRYVYEPGDATRYVFIVTLSETTEDVVTLRIGQKFYSMCLPDFRREGLEVGYVAEKMGTREYEARVTIRFLAWLSPQGTAA